MRRQSPSRYGAQDPSVVASELEQAGNEIAASFAAVQMTPVDTNRRAAPSWP